MSHTKGPWWADKSCSPMIWAKTSAGDMKIADVRGWGHLTGGGALRLPESEARAIQDANADLLAAAPDLLAACKVVTAFLDRLEDPDVDPADSQMGRLRRAIHKPLRDALNPAIAKAEGHAA